MTGASSRRASPTAFTDPSPDDVVAVHAAETDDGEIVPDRDADDRVLVLRVAAAPAMSIVGRAGTVFVNEHEVRRHHDQAVSGR